MPEPAAPPPSAGFLGGLVEPFRGASFIARHGLWREVFLPAALNLMLAGLLSIVVVSWAWNSPWAQPRLAELGALRWVLLPVGVGLLVLLAFVTLQPITGGVWNDRLSERTELIRRGTRPQIAPLSALRMALVHGSLKLLLYGVALVFGTVLFGFGGLGGVVGAVLGGLSIVYDSFDYPLSRRGMGFRAKWRFLLSRPRETAGFAVGAVVLYALPLAFLVAPGVLATGATLACLAALPAPAAAGAHDKAVVPSA